MCVIAASYAHSFVSYAFIMTDTRPNAIRAARIDFVQCERQSWTIGDTRRSALRPRKDLQRDIRHSKVCKYC